MAEQALTSPKQKALAINLDDYFYGSFAEIGGGQEVANNFFNAGGASKTIAKTISAYDMVFSDAIYGPSPNGRYVCEARLLKMLDREYELLIQRLADKRDPKTCYFAFANTVVTINYQKTNQAHGWVGCRFQTKSGTKPNDIVLHVNMHEPDKLKQHHDLGILGVNLVYACRYYYDNIDLFITSLLDNLSPEHIEVDMLRFEGDDFKAIDNRIIALQLVKKGLTKATMFGPDGSVQQPADALYKKDILVLRSRFKPITKLNIDMLKNGLNEFLTNKNVNRENTIVLSELTLNNLKSNDSDISDKDFMDRVEILCALGQTVMISNFQEYYLLAAYLNKLTRKEIGIVLGIMSLEEIFNEMYYSNLKGGLLEAFSRLILNNITLYVYPLKRNNKIVNLSNIELPPHVKGLFNFLVDNQKLKMIRIENEQLLDIYSDKVLQMIQNNDAAWENQVPVYVANIIKEKKLFGYQN